MALIKQTNDNNQLGDLWQDPFRNMDMMTNMVRSMLDRSGAEMGLGQYPVDIDEDEESINIEAEMPGFKKDEIDVSVESGVLTIKGERKPKESNNKHLSERRYTRVQRSFTLPNRVDGSQVEARLEDGLLHIKLMKKEETKPRKIDVK